MRSRQPDKKEIQENHRTNFLLKKNLLNNEIEREKKKKDVDPY